MAEREANGGKDWTKGEDGWTDYRENVNEIDVQEERERHEDKFDPDAFRNSMYGAGQEEKDQEEEEKKEEQKKFLLPPKTQSIGQKIKNLFFR